MNRISPFALFLTVVFFFPGSTAAQQVKERTVEPNEASDVAREKERLRLLTSLQGVGCVPAERDTAAADNVQSIELRFSEVGRQKAALELKNPGRQSVSLAVTIPDAQGGRSVEYSLCPQATTVLELATIVPQDQDRVWVKLRGDITASIVLRDVEGARAKQRFAVETDFEVNRLLIFAGPEDRYQMDSETQPAAVESNFKLRDGSSAHSVREQASALSVVEPPSDAEGGVVRLAYGRRMREVQNR